MSEEKPSVRPSAPQQPDKKNGCSPGCFWVLVAIGLCFAVFLSPVFLSGGEVPIESAPFAVVFYAIIIVAIFVAHPELILIAVLVIGVVIGVVCWRMAKRREMGHKPPIAPQPLPRTQCEESSNQEAEPSELPSSLQQPKKEEGLSIRGILLILGVLGLVGLYVIYIVANIP